VMAILCGAARTEQILENARGQPKLPPSSTGPSSDGGQGLLSR